MMMKQRLGGRVNRLEDGFTVSELVLNDTSRRINAYYPYFDAWSSMMALNSLQKLDKTCIR